MSNLFSDDEGPTSASKSQLTINEHYAKAFEYRKEREELERCKFSFFFSLFVFLKVKDVLIKKIYCSSTSKSKIWV